MTRKNNLVTKFILSISFLLMAMNCLMAQSEKKDRMANLAFMIGDWVGISKSFNKDKTKEVAAYEKIDYKLDESLITIDLMSESLQLHTIIYYDEKDQTYYYCPYSKKGVGKFRGEYKNGQFIVWFSESNRLIFQLTPDGKFQEFGERLNSGKWEKYFEDILNPMH